MSSHNLVNAIVAGDAIEIENAFQSTIYEKISARLDDYRQEVAQTMFKVQESAEELDEQYVVYNHDGKYNKIKKVVADIATAIKHAEKLGGGHKVASMQYWQDKLAPKTNEEVELDEEQLDELSKTTLGSYVKKSTGGLGGAARHAFDAGRHMAQGNDAESNKSFAKSRQRISGIKKAVDRLTK